MSSVSDKIRRAARSGRYHSQHQIADVLGTTQGYVCTVLNKHKENPWPRKMPWFDHNLVIMVIDENPSMTIAEIATEFGVSLSTVRTVCADNHVYRNAPACHYSD